MENINKAVEMVKIVSKSGIVSIGYDVHIQFKTFVSKFMDFETETRTSDDYPYQVYVTIDGVKVFAIASNKEWKDAFPEAKTACELRIEELEKQVQELQGGENL